jgi:hypothetical protein
MFSFSQFTPANHKLNFSLVDRGDEHQETEPVDVLLLPRPRPTLEKVDARKNQEAAELEYYLFVMFREDLNKFMQVQLK